MENQKLIDDTMHLINVEFNTCDFTYLDYVYKWLEQEVDSPE